MGTQARRLGTVGGNYLQTISSDPGGKKAEKIGQSAAARYIAENGTQKGNTQVKAIALIFGVSAVVLSLLPLNSKSDQGQQTPAEARKNVPEYGCIVEVDSDKGLDSAWAIAKAVAPVGELEEVYKDLANQDARVEGPLIDDDILLAPKEACDNNLVQPINQTPSE